MERKGSIWDYFNKCISSDNYKRAQCKFCKKIYSYAATISNLKKHLSHKHGQNISKEKLKSIPRRPRHSIKRGSEKYWDHFTNDEDDYKVAICNYCLNKYSYKSNINNLASHLVDKHTDVYDKYFQNDDLDEVAEEVFIDCIDIESNDSAKLTSKLFKSDPNLAEHEDEDLKYLEGNNENDIFTEVDYLDNPESPNPENRSKWRPQSKKRHRIYNKSDLLNEEKDNKIIKRNLLVDNSKTAEQSDDEVEKFGNYITCLLKKMSKNDSRRIQKNIINMILTSEHEDENLQQLKSPIEQKEKLYTPSFLGQGQ